MLLEFKMKNYKSFKDECVFSLTPAPKQKGLNYSVLSEQIGRNVYKGLCSAVIYGPNASGKTNIIGAMETFKQIVLRGNIRNVEAKDSPNAASNALELIPNNTLSNTEPVSFSITYTDKGLLFDYAITLDLGRFLERDHKRKVLKETLSVNKVMLFTRSDEVEIGDLSVVKPYLVRAYAKNAKGAEALAQSSLHDEELFLANGFKTMFSAKLASMIAEWLDKSFIVIYRSDSMQLVRKFSEPKNKSVYIEKTLNEAAALFGVNSNALGYVLDGKSEEARLCSLFKEDTKQTAAIPVELFESYGTIRFINLFPLVLHTLMQGGILVVDEFDASIHPMALMNIITLFHNDELNVHHAQLVFNTHNPIFLNSNLFRRDEIKFVDRDDATHCSTHYSLSDFGTAGAKGVRKNEDYMKNYVVDRYGAIKNIDLAPIIQALMNKNIEE